MADQLNLSKSAISMKCLWKYVYAGLNLLLLRWNACTVMKRRDVTLSTLDQVSSPFLHRTPLGAIPLAQSEGSGARKKKTRFGSHGEHHSALLVIVWVMKLADLPVYALAPARYYAKRTLPLSFASTFLWRQYKFLFHIERQRWVRKSWMLWEENRRCSRDVLQFVEYFAALIKIVGGMWHLTLDWWCRRRNVVEFNSK